MNYRNDIQSHYEKNWGTIGMPRYWYKGPIDQLYPDFCVLEFKPSKTRQMWTYATCCMSSHEIANPIEVHIFSAVKDEGLVELLTLVAYFHKTEQKLDLNHTLNFGRPWQNQSQCQYGFISLPYLDGPDLEFADIAGYTTPLKFYWLIPITETEVDFKIKYGVDALEKKFEDTKFNYLAENRPSVV